MIELLEVMVEVGIVEEGFLLATKGRGYASVRTPHTKKPDMSSPAISLPLDELF
jgi:hypothetical protein